MRMGSSALLVVLLFHLTCCYNWIPQNCVGNGCMTQQGCVSWNFRRYPCYHTCHFNRCTVESPRNYCHKITHVASQRALVSKEIYDPSKGMKYAIASVNCKDSNVWTLQPAYGGTFFIQNKNTLEFMKVDAIYRTYLMRNEPLDRTFQFRAIAAGEGSSRIQLQSVFNSGYLYVDNQGHPDSTVRITFDPHANYYQTLWDVTKFYC